MAENKHALVVVASPELSAPSALLPKLQAAAVHQVKLIRRTESEASQRALLLGLTLWRIKASMKGTFTGWLKKDFDSLGYRQARYYMSASLAFIEKTKATLPEFLALPGDQAELALDALPEGKGRALMAKIEKFVDGRSLGDLFEDLGIKESAKKKARRLGAASDDDASAEETAAARELTVQDRFNELDQAMQLVRKSTADRALWMSFSKQQHADLKAAADATAEHLTALFVKTHGRK